MNLKLIEMLERCAAELAAEFRGRASAAGLVRSAESAHHDLAAMLALGGLGAAERLVVGVLSKRKRRAAVHANRRPHRAHPHVRIKVVRRDRGVAQRARLAGVGLSFVLGGPASLDK